MAFEKMIKNAFEESENNCRFGDTLEEIAEVLDCDIRDFFDKDVMKESKK